GGLAAVVGALWHGRARLDPDRLADYARRLPVASAGRRLGFLLELLAIDGPDAVSRLLPGRTNTWTLLDPIRAPTGPRLRRWGLRLNVDLPDLLAAAGVEGVVGPLPEPAQASLLPPDPVPVAGPFQVARPRRLAGLCRRYDLLRLVVLEGAWAQVAGTTRRDRQGRLPAFVSGRIQAEGAAYDAPGAPGAPGMPGMPGTSGAPTVIPILAEMHLDRILGPAELLAVERELAQILGCPVVLRTMRELLHRVARLALHAGTVVYHRHDRGQSAGGGFR
ncbi:MAG: hypothetical protein ACYDIE_10295, partial [Candidatus Krumholzibacteriia bacterium]